MIKIRIATAADAQIIALLGHITFTETFGALFEIKEDLKTYLSKTFSVEKILRGLKKNQNVFYIAFVDDLPVGYAKLKLNSSSPLAPSDNSAQLQKIYVLKDFLGMKIGLELQNKLIERAISEKCNSIWLSVLDENERAIGFYKKNDFKEIGEHEFAIGRYYFHFIAMQKTLDLS